MRENIIQKLSDREHCLKRPSMYLGSVKNEKSIEFIYDSKFSKQEVNVTPGLLKIVNEIIDNSVDEAIRTNFKFANKIEVFITETSFRVKDNGRGIPQNLVKLSETNETLLAPVLAWTHIRAGSNFGDESNTIGANGAGSALTNFYSKEFIGITCDGKNECKVICKDNAKEINFIQSPCKQKGTEVTSYPDFKRFDEKKFTTDYLKVIRTRLYILAVAYPQIKFSFNDEVIKLNPKDFFNLFSTKEMTIEKTEKYSLCFFTNETDEFTQFSILNGLYLKSGGSHIDYIVNQISNILREKLSKKYPNIKTADIKNKLFFISLMKDFKDAKFDSQTKEKLTNSQKELSAYFNLDLEVLANKIFKNKEIMNSITDFFRIKEEFAKRKELQKLEKVKKFKSEKYTAPVGENDYLFLCEGFSAVSSLQSCLGRKGKGYYELKGKVQNVCENDKAITQNKELKELYQIVKNQNFKKIIIATDQDVDGIHIASLLINFFYTFLPEAFDKIYRLETPLIIGTEGSKVVDFSFSLKDNSKVKGNRKYMKGLGSWTKETLKQVIDKSGFDTLLKQIITDKENDKEALLDWFETKRSDIRKSKIKNNNFSIAKI